MTLENKLTYLTLGMLTNNIVGSVFYSGLLIVEHLIMGFLLLISCSHSKDYHYLINLDMITVTLIKSDNISVHFAFCVVYFSIQVLATFMLIKIMVSCKSYE